MKKLLVALYVSVFVSLGLFAQAASAAPMGWYDLGLTWRDGSFAGKILYDGSSPYQVLQVQGTLTDLAQTTAISDVWNASNGIPVSDFPLTFTNWDGVSDPLNYNAAFSLVLSDLGNALAVANPGQSWGLYDWSNPDLAGLLSDSPLLSWSIAPSAAAVPEPAPLALMALGVVAFGLARRRKPAQRG